MTSWVVLKRADGIDTWTGFSGEEQERLEPNPAYYALLPITVPFDIATLPIQCPLFIYLFFDERPAPKIDRPPKVSPSPAIRKNEDETPD